MSITRRAALQWLAVGSAASLAPLSRFAQALHDPVSRPYWPQWDSLQQHSCPDWFRDAKFGIYFHWGLYSVPAFGNEWYPHWMYRPDRPEYQHHVATYGPVNRFGYKDFAAAFTGEHFDADAWVTLFRRAGARYVGPVTEHADGFSMWASRINRWNAARMGPRRDVVAEMEHAVRKHGLKFVTTFHHSWLWGWYSSPIAGADIYQPQYADFYWPQSFRPGREGSFSFAHPDPAPTPHFCDVWRDKVIEVIDRYQPDLLYFDNRVAIIPERYRLEMLAHFYNSGARSGREVVMTYKERDFATGSGVLDIEAGQLTESATFPWQTDDKIDWRSWAYLTKPDYKSAGRILHQLIDIVSKNGNLLLDIGPRPDGTIPTEVESRLLRIGAWLHVNGEAVYGTRPAACFGEGPTQVKKGSYVADRNSDFTAHDLRFTTRPHAFYIHVLGVPGSQVRVASLKRDKPLPFGTLHRAEMLGSSQPLDWKWTTDGLVLGIPESRPFDEALVIKLT